MNNIKYPKEVVSVPSRGMGGFLHEDWEYNVDYRGGFRPLSRYGWFPTHRKDIIWSQSDAVSVPSRGMGGFLPADHLLGLFRYSRFPSPLEVWVVSYSEKNYAINVDAEGFRPLSRYGWFPTPYLVSPKGFNT